jgi:hypothetical protein
MVKYSDQVKLCKTGPSDIFGACRHTEKSVLPLALHDVENLNKFDVAQYFTRETL